MRRTLFRKSVEVHPPARASVAGSAVFRRSRPFRKRRSGARRAPPRRLDVRAVAALDRPFRTDRSACSLDRAAAARAGRSSPASCLPLAAALALDAAAGLIAMLLAQAADGAAHRRPADVRLSRRDRHVVGDRAALRRARPNSPSASFVTVAMAAGFFLRSIIAVPSPPLAVVNALVAFVAHRPLFAQRRGRRSRSTCWRC